MTKSPLQEKGNEVFLWVSLGWLAMSAAICAFISPDLEKIWVSEAWMVLFWALCVLDLWVLAKFVSEAIKWMNAEPKKKPAHSIQALCWGVFKVVCLGLFIGILLKGYEIPTYGLFLGVATLVVIPLVGGFLWSQRILSNA